ncbi:MAG TPA: SDR family oxidoreductase [Steroidobacteraceae bacterium]|nr:SDR family oxidoreductase [Steroidobacteraceae bacterium]
MRVLIAGASGFIGANLAHACAGAGHEVICGGRQPRECVPGARQLRLDYAVPAPRDVLAQALRGVEVVVNAVGILRPRGAQTFEALHARGPAALFAAAQAAGVRRIVQVSALGAEPQALSAYHRSKSEADLTLMALPVDWAIVKPSLVYGPGGASAHLFDTLASLPLIPLPAGGLQRIQPVHIDDVTRVLLRLIESPAELRCTVQLVGAEPTTLAEFLHSLRAAIGLRPTRALSIPRPLMAAAASLGDHLPGAFLSHETLGMLERGNVGDPTEVTRLLGRPPLPVSAFVNPSCRSLVRREALSGWLTPLLRWSVAFMWLIAGIVSLGPQSGESLELLRRIGASAAVAPLLLVGAASLDIALGILTLLPRRIPMLWNAQILLVLLYTAIISVFLPELWLEPFGPVAKNVPILAMLLLLRQHEGHR